MEYFFLWYTFNSLSFNAPSFDAPSTRNLFPTCKQQYSKDEVYFSVKVEYSTTKGSESIIFWFYAPIACDSLTLQNFKKKKIELFLTPRNFSFTLPMEYFVVASS